MSSRKKLPIIALAVLFVGLLGWGIYGRLSAKSRPSIVLLLLDTLRADHLSLYGYERNTSPNIDSFGRENLVFDYAVPAAPWTPPSVAAILSGLYVTSHGLMPPNGRELAKNASAKLNSKVDTIAEILKRNGYLTAGITPNPWTNQEFGFEQGFDVFKYLPRAPAGEITKAGMKVIEAWQDKKQPFFMYLHYLDPHAPYTPPEAYKDLFQGPLKSREYPAEMVRKIGLYDGEINYLDSALGKLFAFFKEKGLYDDLVIVIVADHGEQFMERGNEGHGFQLFGEEIHVPLILKAGRRAPVAKRVENTVSTIDIFPTFLELAGIEASPTLQGVSLLNEGKLAQRAGVFSEISRRFDQRAFVSREGKKLIVGAAFEGEKVNSSDPHEHIRGVFDLKKDVHELSPLNDSDLLEELQMEFTAAYQTALENRVSDGKEKGEVSNDTLDQLKSLGYME